ncbi:MFS transporter [Pseudonocardia sp.]|jgi:metabolite-proton symporter|uniref:MFS transporter n=1 Tax=Pseudonocardia sp. TaxID=60912 RepID=UPI00260647CF|nr:MFS transporter [Pseudonocardia sp.]MCW2716206.1 transporter [Pseudonocardia sp.]
MTVVTAPSRNRIAVASFVGTAIEFYDFYIYGTAAALVFGKLFFPSFSPVAGTLAALATFAVGFIARPIGAILFGHFGDRVGRKQMLIVSLLMMGLSTVAIGLVPSYATIGVAAPTLLALLRFVQGIGLGGEWGGAVLLATEHAPPGKRGLYSAFPQLGPAIGFALGNALFLLLGASMSPETFESWGWRIPFLASAVLLVVGFYVRMRISETPVFQAALDAQAQARVPFLELLRRQPKVLLLATLSFVLAFTMFYTITTFCLTYGTATLQISRTTMLVEAIVASLVMGAATLWFAVLSDRIGRRSLCIAAAVLCAVWAFPLFWLVQTRQPLLVGIGMTVGLIGFALLYGPMGAYFPELFRVRFRYSGSSFAYSAAGIIGGGVSPIVATDILARTGSTTGVSWYLVSIAALCLVCLLFLRETRDADFTDGLAPRDR